MHEQIATLSKRKVGPLANRGQGEAATLKTMVESYRGLYGNPDSVTFTFGARALSSESCPASPVIEVSAASPSDVETASVTSVTSVTG